MAAAEAAQLAALFNINKKISERGEEWIFYRRNFHQDSSFSFRMQIDSDGS